MSSTSTPQTTPPKAGICATPATPITSDKVKAVWDDLDNQRLPAYHWPFFKNNCWEMLVGEYEKNWAALEARRVAKIKPSNKHRQDPRRRKIDPRNIPLPPSPAPAVFAPTKSRWSKTPHELGLGSLTIYEPQKEDQAMSEVYGWGPNGTSRWPPPKFRAVDKGQESGCGS